MSSFSPAGRLPLVLALGFAAVLIMQATKAHRILNERAQSQAAVTESVQRWKQSYMALADTAKKWESSYRREESIQDLVSLYEAVGLTEYGLRADTDSVMLQKVDPVTQNGMPIGLTKFCLASAASSESMGLQVQALNYQALFAGIKRLAKRPDIYIGTITVRGDKELPVANLGEFCVLLRKV